MKMMSNMKTSVFLRAQLSLIRNRLIVNLILEIPNLNPRNLYQRPRLRLRVEPKGANRTDIELTDGPFPIVLAQLPYQREIRKL